MAIQTFNFINCPLDIRTRCCQFIFYSQFEHESNISVSFNTEAEYYKKNIQTPNCINGMHTFNTHKIYGFVHFFLFLNSLHFIFGSFIYLVFLSRNG